MLIIVVIIYAATASWAVCILLNIEKMVLNLKSYLIFKSGFACSRAQGVQPLPGADS